LDFLARRWSLQLNLYSKEKMVDVALVESIKVDTPLVDATMEDTMAVDIPIIEATTIEEIMVSTPSIEQQQQDHEN
jgi:hypothetical protein